MKKIMLTSVLSIFVLLVSVQGKEIASGGFGGFTLSSVYNSYSALNTKLIGAGYKTVNNGFYFGQDGCGYGVVNNILIGGSSFSSKALTENDSNSTTIECQGGYFDIGYLFSPTNFIDVFPLVGFGSLTYSLFLHPSVGNVNFDSLLINPGRVSTVTKKSFSMALSGNIMFKIPVFGRYSFIGVLLGGGYALSPSFGSWKTSDGLSVTHGPDMPIGVPFVKLSVVFGGGLM